LLGKKTRTKRAPPLKEKGGERGGFISKARGLALSQNERKLIRRVFV